MKIRGAEKRDKKSRVQVGVVASNLALDVEKPDAKCVSFQECTKKVSQKYQDGISMLIKGKELQVPKSPCLYPDHVFLDSCYTFIQMIDENLLSDVCKSDTYLYVSLNHVKWKSVCPLFLFVVTF